MNKSELTKQAKFDDKTLDAILEALGILKNLPDYTDEHLKLVQTIKDIHKNEGCKSWAEAVSIHRKPINEAQLKEIADRYSLSDRVPEITSALKLKPESITTEQFEQFRIVCEQVQKGMDLQMVANAQLDKGKAAKAKPAMPEFASQSEPGSAIAPTKDKPKSGLIARTTQPVDLTGIPIDGGVARYWDRIAEVGAAADADDLAGAPFDGIVEGSEFVGDKAEALRQHGFNLYMEKFDTAMKDPELIKRVEDKYLGKLPERWNLKKPN